MITILYFSFLLIRYRRFMILSLPEITFLGLAVYYAYIYIFIFVLFQFFAIFYTNKPKNFFDLSILTTELHIVL